MANRRCDMGDCSKVSCLLVAPVAGISSTQPAQHDLLGMRIGFTQTALDLRGVAGDDVGRRAHAQLERFRASAHQTWQIAQRDGLEKLAGAAVDVCVQGQGSHAQRPGSNLLHQLAVLAYLRLRLTQRLLAARLQA